MQLLLLSAGWVTFSRSRKEKTMAERLANEIIDATNGVGASVKRREDLYKMAEANRALLPLPLLVGIQE